ELSAPAGRRARSAECGARNEGNDCGTRSESKASRLCSELRVHRSALGSGTSSLSAVRLEVIQNELVALVVAAAFRQVVLPLLVIDWSLHFRRIAIIEIFARAVVLVAPEILRIPHVRIVVEPLPVGPPVLAAPNAVERPLLGAGRSSQPCQQHGGRHGQ